MSTPNLTVNAGDFDELKQSFKTFLAAKAKFTGYDLDGPNIDQLLSVLAFNSYQNLFYHNMAVNETFIDTAFQRDSVVSRAKELNYTPRSFKSAVATVNIEIRSSNLSRSSIIIPKGTLFVSRIGDRSFSFTTDRTIITNTSVVEGSTIKFTASGVDLFEGHYLTETIPIIGSTPLIIPNQQIDISSLTVAVLEDNGGVVVPYRRVSTLYGVDETSPIYFIEGAADSKYQIAFGNNIFGRSPKTNSVAALDYRVSNGELPNGARDFRAGQSIDGETDITVKTTTAAHSGAIHEDTDSIKFNAPRHYSSQERAVVPSDYSNLLRENFPELVDVIAYGGEQASPPRYGHVLLSAVLNGVDYLPKSKQTEYLNFLRTKTMMTPLFVEPLHVFVQVTSNVKFDPSIATLNPDDLRVMVVNAIDGYSSTNLNRFGKPLRFSRLTSAIDAADKSIISNDTFIKLIATITEQNWNQSRFNVEFNAPLSAVISDEFTYNNSKCIIVDNKGILDVKSVTNDQVVQSGIGSIDYKTGTVQIVGFRPSVVASIDITATPTTKDIAASNNGILKIRENDVTVNVIRGA